MPKEKKEKPIGKVTHYYDKIGVAIIKLSAGLKEGDEIKIKGNTTDFNILVKSMEADHKKIKKAKKGDIIGLKVKEKTRESDLVYKA